MILASRFTLQFFSQAGDRYVELFAVLGYRPPGNVIALIIEYLFQLVIGVGLVLVFAFDDILDYLLHLTAAYLLARIRRDAFREKVF